QIGAIATAWKSGDPDELACLMNFAEDDRAFAEAMLIGRNRMWAKWIDERLGQPGTVFVAVGAGHLAGASSVQEQLAARGIGMARVQ
ncbi:MAG: TraB/GumN family protein, partial [Alphaproteobacteria bacterium]|nr:TraB/GumN family protein [Alphaproteobacteria bacterium]